MTGKRRNWPCGGGLRPSFGSSCGMEHCVIEVLNIASAGDVVLTERIDHMHRADGSEIFTFRIMGTFVLRGGLIARYTDYYDSLGAARALGRL